MTDTANMQLVFRLGGMGFVLPIDDLVEIREADAPPGAGNGGDDRRGAPRTAGPGRAFGLADPAPAGGALLVFLRRPVALDTMGGAASRASFRKPTFAACPCRSCCWRDFPLPFEGLALWREEPLHACRALQLERFGRRA